MREPQRRVQEVSAFHRVILGGSRNDFLARFVATLAPFERLHQSEYLDREEAEAIQADHEAILAALQARDGDAAAREMLAHYDRGRAYWRKVDEAEGRRITAPGGRRRRRSVALPDGRAVSPADAHPGRPMMRGRREVHPRGVGHLVDVDGLVGREVPGGGAIDQGLDAGLRHVDRVGDERLRGAVDVTSTGVPRTRSCAAESASMSTPLVGPDERSLAHEAAHARLDLRRAGLGEERLDVGAHRLPGLPRHGPDVALEHRPVGHRGRREAGIEVPEQDPRQLRQVRDAARASRRASAWPGGRPRPPRERVDALLDPRDVRDPTAQLDLELHAAAMDGEDRHRGRLAVDAVHRPVVIRGERVLRPRPLESWYMLARSTRSPGRGGRDAAATSASIIEASPPSMSLMAPPYSRPSSSHGSRGSWLQPLVHVARVDVPVEQQARRLAGAAQPDDDVGSARQRRVDVDVQARMVHELGDRGAPAGPRARRACERRVISVANMTARSRSTAASRRLVAVADRRASGRPQRLKRRRTLAVMRETWSLTGSEQTQLIEPVEKTSPPDAVSKVTISEPPSWGLMPLASRRVPGGL